MTDHVQSSTPTVLITGATGGIGLALAQQYDRRRARLVLVGRRPLETLSNPLLTSETYCQADLCSADSPQIIAAWLSSRQVRTLDLLIHNAGLGFVGHVADQSAENIQSLVDVNLTAPIALTHLLLPLLEERSGLVAFISSVASVLPGPDYAVYTASKAALDGFARNLRIELAAQKSRVKVALVHPGATRTGMHAKAGLDSAATDWAKFAPVDRVAKQIAQGLDRRRKRFAVGGANRLALRGALLAPGTIDCVYQTTRRGRTPRLPLPLTRATTGPVRHCVITGAADGIGRALARRLATDGWMVTGVDVDGVRAVQTRDELRKLGSNAEFLIADLSRPKQVQTLLDDLTNRPPVDLLIHNAGINATGPFSQLDLPRQLTVIRVNLLAPLLLTAGLLRAGRLAPGGDVVCIGSLSTYVGYPGATVYAATKDGLASYARSLRIALAPEGINVLVVFPGPTKTAHARRHSPDNSREDKRMPPAELADHIVDAVRRRKSALAPGIGNKLFLVAGRLAPRLTEQAMRRTIFDKFVP